MNKGSFYERIHSLNEHNHILDMEFYSRNFKKMYIESVQLDIY
jgi:hypothetical protein